MRNPVPRSLPGPSPRRPRRPRRASSDERGQMVIVLLIILTASILVLIAAGVAISQQLMAQRTVQRNDALEAADAGLDAAIGELRGANNGNGNGVPEDLPVRPRTVSRLLGTSGRVRAPRTPRRSLTGRASSRRTPTSPTARPKASVAIPLLALPTPTRCPITPSSSPWARTRVAG